MSRIKIDLPESWNFSTIIPIRITDLNYGKHVGNDSILSLIHEARVQFLHHHGFGELEFAGASLIMSDAGIEYKSELKYGHTITAYVAAGDFSKVAFNIYYKLVNNETGAVVALAKTGMVCFNYDLNKVVAIPAAAKEKLDS